MTTAIHLESERQAPVAGDRASHGIVLRGWAALTGVLVALSLTLAAWAPRASAAITDPEVKKTISGGLDWLAYQQHKLGHWTAQGRYPTAMTSLAGLALLCEGSTTTEGKYAENIRRAVDFLV